MVHSGILCALCLIGCVESVATLGLWSAELARLESGEGGIINTEISIYAILTVSMHVYCTCIQYIISRECTHNIAICRCSYTITHNVMTVCMYVCTCFVQAVCLASAALYLVRACWIRAAIKGKWDEKN